MSVEGLRAWIGEVERKLAKRTRVFLALTVIAIGIAGASVYLAIDARNDSVSEGDVQELQRELETQIDEAAAGEAGAPAEPIEPPPTGGLVPPGEETTPETPQQEQQRPKSGDGGKEGSSGTGGAGTGGASADGRNDADRAGNPKIEELLEQAQEENAEAEEKQAGADPSKK